MNDLRSMLKLALGLHTVGDPLQRLKRALDGIARLAGADAWVAGVWAARTDRARSVLKIFTGGSDARASQTARAQIEVEWRRRDSSIAKFLARPEQIPGRVFAMIDPGSNAIFTVLLPEKSGQGRLPMTWISLHRDTSAPPFLERERRVAELFHSQSAWLLSRTADK